MTTQRAFFISDAHLGARIPTCEARQEHLLQFLRSTVSGSSDLFILGDLFDFWIEYRFAIRSDYFRAVHALADLIDNGTCVHYVVGNHDFALGSFLRDTVGIDLPGDHVDMTLQGKKLHLYHGDGIVKADAGYRVLKRVLRNPAGQRFYRMLHPNLGIPLAGLFSGSSRKLLRLRINNERIAEYRAAAKSYLDAGSDVVVFGHTHAPELSQWGEKTYCNSGQWIRRYTYAIMEDGVMSLWEHSPGANPTPIQATCWK